MMDSDDDSINIQIFVPELQVRVSPSLPSPLILPLFQKCLTVANDDFVWDVKRKLLASLPQVYSLRDPTETAVHWLDKPYLG